MASNPSGPGSETTAKLPAGNQGGTGWGGINSTWGAGVTDTYSLLFLDTCVRISRLTGGLGWIYTAGTCELSQYLAAKMA